MMNVLCKVTVQVFCAPLLIVQCLTDAATSFQYPLGHKLEPNSYTDRLCACENLALISTGTMTTSLLD